VRSIHRLGQSRWERVEPVWDLIAIVLGAADKMDAHEQSHGGQVAQAVRKKDGRPRRIEGNVAARHDQRLEHRTCPPLTKARVGNTGQERRGSRSTFQRGHVGRRLVEVAPSGSEIRAPGIRRGMSRTYSLGGSHQSS